MKKNVVPGSLPVYEVETLVPGAQMQFRQINEREFGQPYESVIEFRITGGTGKTKDITILVGKEEAISIKWALNEAIGI